MNSNNVKLSSPTLEGIDFNKLKIVIQRNWLWIVLILILINATAFLLLRYTKNIYESESVIKLEIKSEATGLGIKGLINEPGTNLISGEIEIIQSRIFLNRVIDSVHFDISFYSIGHVLNTDLFHTSPVYVKYKINDMGILNTPIYFDFKGDGYTLRVGEKGKDIAGQFNVPLALEKLEVTLTRNNAFGRGSETGYYFVLNSNAALLNELTNNLSVEPLNFNANTIRIAIKDSNPLRAQSLLNKIDSIYLQYSNEQKNLANKQKIDWLSNELHQVEKKMEEYETYFENFTLENKTNDLEDGLKQTVSMINKVDTQRFQMTQRINQINQLTDGIHTANLLNSPTYRYSLPDYITKNLDDIQQLYLEQEKLKLSYNETTFAYREKEKTIDYLKTKTINQLAELKAECLRKLHELNKRKSTLENEFANMPDKNTQFSKNKRFYKLYEEFYLMMMKSKSEFEIAQAGSIPDFKILSPATMPVTPILPKNGMIIGIGMMTSLFVCLFFIGILYLLNNKITNTHELERLLDVPILGVIPSSYNSNSKTLHILEHPKSMVSEAIRTIRTNLDFFNTGSSKKVIAISSTVSGEGKSFIALNLGGVLALSKKKVILLDLDMRKAKTNLPVHIEDKAKGISTVLIRKNTWQECLIKTAFENFDYIPSGPHPPNPSELLLNGDFSNLIEELKNQYDFIILDTPPVGLVTDGIMAMKRADIAIYVFRANYSKKDFLLNLKRIISINKFTNITTLLNAMPSNTEKGYGYGYYEEIKKPNRLLSIFKKT